MPGIEPASATLTWVAECARRDQRRRAPSTRYEDAGQPLHMTTVPSPRSGSQPGKRVLIFTANAGGGHLAAARAIKRELERDGHNAVIEDGLALMSGRL